MDFKYKIINLAALAALAITISSCSKKEETKF